MTFVSVVNAAAEVDLRSIKRLMKFILADDGGCECPKEGQEINNAMMPLACVCRVVWKQERSVVRATHVFLGK